MESMPAPGTPVTVGVDTHLDQHVAAVIDPAGRLCGTQAFPASTRGSVALVTWAERFGPVERIGVEGTGTYGAGLARFARAYGLKVVEVDRPDRSTRRRRGRSDPIDAQAAARATLAGVAATTPKTRDGQAGMIRVLRVARRGALKARVAAAEQLHGVLYSAPLRDPRQQGDRGPDAHGRPPHLAWRSGRMGTTMLTVPQQSNAPLCWTSDLPLEPWPA